jgi:hypothetical protein
MKTKGEKNNNKVGKRERDKEREMIVQQKKPVDRAGQCMK